MTGSLTSRLTAEGCWVGAIIRLAPEVCCVGGRISRLALEVCVDGGRICNEAVVDVLVGCAVEFCVCCWHPINAKAEIMKVPARRIFLFM